MATTDINSQMFFALKVSEKSRVPLLFMSAPGMGKSTTVEFFAKHNGYAMEILRGNSTSESEIMGYDVVDPTPGAKTTIHLRPSWFGNVMKNAETFDDTNTEAEVKEKLKTIVSSINKSGKKTLLFVDEITTCPEHVQSALLHLIFERKVGNEKIPEDTLIVSAGNYSQSLGSSFGLIPPLMNRFCIFNIIPTIDNFEEMVCHSHGAAIGKAKTLEEVINEKFKKLDSRAIEEPSKETILRIREIIEDSVMNVTRMLSVDHKAGGKEAKFDPKVTDVQSIYTDVDNDDPLRGFVTIRTLNYAVDMALATWLCFGKSGFTDTCFLNILNGLVGLGLTRNSSTHVVTPHYIAEDYFTRLKNASVEIEKLGNTTVMDYNKFFADFIKNSLPNKDSVITKEQAGILNDKISAVKRDPKMVSISKPLDIQCLERILQAIHKSMQPIGHYDLKNQANKTISVSELSGAIAEWNIYSDLFTNIGKLIEDKANGYDEASLKMINQFKSDIRVNSRKFDTAKKFVSLTETDKKALSLIPEIHREYVALPK